MTELKIKPPETDLFYVTIDGTRAIDSLVFGQRWQQFGWKNLLSGLNTPSTDKNRRIDTTHLQLPILFMSETQQFPQADGSIKKGGTFADVVIMPEGRDGTGVDDGNWPSKDKDVNAPLINAANNFIQGFILNPSCDPANSALGTGTRLADLVYVSSHGIRTGDMFGEASNYIDEVDPFFIPVNAAAIGGKFVGVKWLILSNCNTLVKETHNDWLKLMTASTSFRGIIGYHGTSVAADASSGANGSFIAQLASGKTIVDAWRQANKAWGMTDRWVVLCHDAAKGDTIAQWNAGTLPAVPFAPTPTIKLFDEANLSGAAVAAVSDPFGVFWSKTVGAATTKITPANRYAKGNKIKPGDDVSITVVSAPNVATFAADTVIQVTLIFVREDYPEPIDVTKMFNITATTNIDASVTTAHRNTQRTDKGADTWIMKVVGTPASVTLGLKIQNPLFLGDVHHNLMFWLKASFQPPTGTGVPTFDFIHDAAIFSA